MQDHFSTRIYIYFSQITGDNNKKQMENPATSVKQEYPTLYNNIPYGISLPCSVFNLTIYCQASWQQAVQVEVESD